MIRFILKLWSNNTDLFAEAVRLKREGVIDGVELYNNVKESLDWNELEAIKDANVITIHNPHSHGWHDFFLIDEQKMQWQQTKKLADFFGASHIIIHPARTQTRETFFENLKKLDDTRIMVENMAGLDIDRQPMQYGVTLEDLKDISTHAPICFDLEKAVKGAALLPPPQPAFGRGPLLGQEGTVYKTFITEAIQELHPRYFHISSGVATDAMDQHFNLWEGDIDMRWMKQQLLDYSKDKDIFLAFETPKMDGLANDVRNMDFFRSL